MRNFDSGLAMYQPVTPTVVLSRQEWLGEGWQDLPAHRIELNGEREEPLIVQWAGDPDALARALAPDGYVPAPAWSLATFAGFLAGQTPPEDLPALPRIQNGRGAELVLIKRDGDLAETPEEETGGRWVLRRVPICRMPEMHSATS